ncbi:MAG: hypothetical protein ABSE62_06210 [Chthoniobacteraceae bacterium]|jgi:hypothetical protein
MKTNLTSFQREFRRAREAADRGESVIIEAGDRRYVFEALGEPGNPFKGLEDVFGAVHLGVKKGTHRERIRQRLAAKHRR